MYIPAFFTLLHWKNFAGFDKLIRLPNLLIILLTQYLARVCLIGPKAQWLEHLVDLHFLMLPVSTLCIAAAGYIINDYYDVKIDTINKPDRVIIGKSIRRRTAMVSNFALNFIGIGIGFMLSIEIGLFVFFSGFFLWFYSNLLKRLPFVGNLTISLLTAASIFIVTLYFREKNYLIYMFATFSFFITLIREIIKDMEDVRGDMHFGCRTLPIVWGYRRSKTVIYAVLGLFIGSVIFLILLINRPILTYYFYIMLLPTGYFVYKLYWADTTRAYHHLSSFCKWVMLSGVLVMLAI